MVVEMERSHSGCFERKALTRLDFPAPDGAAIISSRPAWTGPAAPAGMTGEEALGPDGSLKILCLLANLLNQQFHLDHDLTEFGRG